MKRTEGKTMKPISESEYHGGDYIFVKVGKEINDSVRLHEISHQILMKFTHWGNMMYMQVQFRRADRMKRRSVENAEIGNLLMHAAETVFESHAILNQLLYLKREHQSEFDKIINGPYYKLYKQKYFDIFLSLDMKWDEVACLAQSLPQLALATDLMDVPPKCWKSKEALLSLIESNPLRYNPDIRYEHLIDVYMKLLEEYSPEQITKSLIAQKSGIYIETMQYDTPMQIFKQFSDVFRQAYDDESVRRAFVLIEKTLVQGELEEIVIDADALDVPLPTNEIETILLEKIEPWLNECQVLKLIPYEESITLEYHITEFSKRYVIACTWEALPIFFAKYNKTILLYSEDYDYMKEKFPYLKSRRIFYYFEGTYKYFCEHIKDKTDTKPAVCLYRISDYTFCIFVKGKANEIIFTAQNKGGMQMFIEDIQKGKYVYKNLKEKKIDDVFFLKDTDCSVYEDAIKSVLHVKHTKGRCKLEF